MSQDFSRIDRRTAFQVAATLAAGGTAIAQEPNASGLKAGAANVDITLPLGATNGGIIMRGGPAKRVHDPMYARCVVLDDGQTKMAFVVCDLRMIDRSIVDRGKKIAADELGWPVEHMLVSATHTHATPGLTGRYDNDIDRWYAEFISMRIADVIRMAVRNLRPARIGWTSVEKPEHVFNRRWHVAAGKVPANPFGEVSDQVVMNPPKSLKLIEPAGPVDPRLSLLSVQGTDGKPIALLANYGLHYVGGYHEGQVSADYFGIFAREVASLLGVRDQDPPFVAMMSNGTSGDVNNSNFLKPRGPQPPWTQMQAVAHDLAVAAVASLNGLEHREDHRLKAAASKLALGVRRPSDSRVDWARKMMADEPNPARLSRSHVYAQEILHLLDYPDTFEVILQAFRIGELGIAAAPCEVFAESGLSIRRASPTRSTFTIELANGYAGYLPTPRQHALGGYETWPARSSFLEIEASDKIEQELLRLLQQASS